MKKKTLTEFLQDSFRRFFFQIHFFLQNLGIWWFLLLISVKYNRSLRLHKRFLKKTLLEVYYWRKIPHHRPSQSDSSFLRYKNIGHQPEAWLSRAGKRGQFSSARCMDALPMCDGTRPERAEWCQRRRGDPPHGLSLASYCTTYV